MTNDRKEVPTDEQAERLPYPPIVVVTGDDGREHRVGVHEYRTGDRSGGVVTFAVYIGDHKWVEAELDPAAAKTVSDLILSKPSVAALKAVGPSAQQRVSTEFLSLVDAHQRGKMIEIEHDGFSGTVIGWYITREGKPGVVLQLWNAKVVHVYSTKWLKD